MPVLLLGGFGAVIVALFAWQMIATWDSTFGPAFEALAAAIENARIRILGHSIHLPAFLSNAVRGLAADFRAGLGVIAEKSAAPLVRAFAALRNLVLYPVRELHALASDTAEALWSLRRHVVPAFIAAAVAWIPRHLATLDAKVAALLRRAPVHITKDVTNYAKGAFTSVVQNTVAIPRSLINGLERDYDALRKRLGRLERVGVPALTAAAITALVARTAFRWVRCSKVEKVGRNACAMDDGLLDSLLADTLIIAGTISLVEFAEGLQAGIGEVAPQIQHFWRA